MFGTTKVKLDKDLVAKIKRYADLAGYSSPEEFITHALEEVYDPCCSDRGVSIVDMGVVEDVRVSGSHVDIDLLPTTGWCPFIATMSSAIPDRLMKLDGIESVDVTVVWEPGWTPDRLSDFARDQLSMPLEELEPYREQRLARRGGAH